ncbi:MAG TPA: beta-galactosidase, partial [Roseimicrobium sp.]|nr:beta-galactosidase [Roseimicrobium sp.]
LPIDETGLVRGAGTRRAYCLNSDIYWAYSKKIVTAMATAVADHPALIAWQIDNGLGRHESEYSFNPETKRDWHAWLKAKYETIDKLNDLMGMSFWGRTVSDWTQVPMPVRAPAPHNPALLTDWRRFSSDTCVAYVRMQAAILREITPNAPVTTGLRAWACDYDYFDLAEELDFISIDSDAAIKSKSSEIACSIDLLRSLKKTGIRTPDGGDSGFWVIEQKAGNVSWQETNALVRPDVVRLFTYQLISRGADGVLYFYWRQPRIGPEKFYGGVLTHDGTGNNRMYAEVKKIGEELTRLAPELKGTRVTAEACILYCQDSNWAQQQIQRPNKFFSQREHIQLFHTALHDKNIQVDFAGPSDDLSRYKMVIAPSLHLISGAAADRLKLYVQNGGTLVGTFNTGLVDEHLITPADGYPNELTDLFGMTVQEFDSLPPGEENHLAFKGAFHTSHMHPAKLWCDIIEPGTAEVLATYAKDFYTGRPAMTMNQYGNGRAIYIGFMSHQNFYADLVAWLRTTCGLFPLLKVPDSVEVSMRASAKTRVYFLLNHQNSNVRLQFYKPTHDFLTGKTISGTYDLPPHGVLVLDEHSRT